MYQNYMLKLLIGIYSKSFKFMVNKAGGCPV